MLAHPVFAVGLLVIGTATTRAHEETLARFRDGHRLSRRPELLLTLAQTLRESGLGTVRFAR